MSDILNLTNQKVVIIMEYTKVLKHCRKVVSNKDELGLKAVLKGVHHVDNTVSATDGKRLIYTELDNAKFNEYIVDVKSGELVNGKYPDIDRLLLSENSEIQLNVDKKTIEDMKRVLRRIKKAGFEHIELKAEKENDEVIWYLQPKINLEINITDFDKTELRYAFGRFSTDEDFKEQKKIVDIKYFVNAIDFIKDNKGVGTKLMMTNSALTPIQFTNQDGDSFVYKYLVMPMRPH